MPEVTVLMSVFNDSKTVRAAIDSIRVQTFRDWELLIVDDGSTDETPHLLHEAQQGDARICVIRNEVNLGLATALNRGIHLAKGNLIARMDADDVSMPDRLDRQVTFMRENRDVDVLGGAAELVNDQGEVIGILRRPESHDVLLGERYSRTPFVHPSIMARREFFSALGGYDERLRKSQDYDLWLRGAEKFRFHNLSDVVIRYRYRRPSIRAIVYGTAVLIRAAWRERKLVCVAYAMRYFLGGVTARLRVRR